MTLGGITSSKKETLLRVLPSLLVRHSFSQKQKIFPGCNLLLESLKINAELQSLIFYRLLLHMADIKTYEDFSQLVLICFLFSQIMLDLEHTWQCTSLILQLVDKPAWDIKYSWLVGK